MFIRTPVVTHRGFPNYHAIFREMVHNPPVLSPFRREPWIGGATVTPLSQSENESRSCGGVTLSPPLWNQS